MSAEASAALLRRKTGTAPTMPALAVMTPAKALRLALARASDQVLGIAAALRGLDDDTVPLDALVDGLEAPALFCVIHGEGGRGGILALCPQILAGLIEAQTMGKVLPTPAEPRPPTRTDAVMASVWIDALLAGLEGLAPDLPGAPPLSGYRYGQRAADPPAVGMALEDVLYRRWTVELELAKGAKTGKLVLAIPAQAQQTDAGRAGRADWTATLERSVLESETRLEAILARVSLSLAEIAAMTVGDVLPLSSAELTAIEITGPDGTALATARLGRIADRRAVRMAVGPQLVVDASPSSAQENISPVPVEPRARTDHIA